MNLTEAKKILENWEENKADEDNRPVYSYKGIAMLLEAQRVVLVDEMVKLSDRVESQYETEFNEWRAFKGFRNTLRDKYLKD